jgi:hypothetical protein
MGGKIELKKLEGQIELKKLGGESELKKLGDGGVAIREWPVIVMWHHFRKRSLGKGENIALPGRYLFSIDHFGCALFRNRVILAKAWRCSS